MILKDVPNVIVVASGKGGVGKTTVATDIAQKAAEHDGSVGLVDSDVSTPNSVSALAPGDGSVEDQRLSTGEDLLAPEVGGVQVISEELLLPDDVAVMRDAEWRARTVIDYIQNVQWNEDTHTVVIDSPPGNGSEIQTVLSEVPLTSAYIVTTPHESSQLDAGRTHEMFTEAGVPHAAIVNMAYIPGEDLTDHVIEGMDFTNIDGIGDATDERVKAEINDSISDYSMFGYDGTDGIDVGAEIEAVIPYTTNGERRRAALADVAAPREEVEA